MDEYRELTRRRLLELGLALPLPLLLPACSRGDEAGGAEAGGRGPRRAHCALGADARSLLQSR